MPKLVLFDFGAMREVPENFATNFIGLLKAAHSNHDSEIIKYGTGLKYLREDDPDSLKQTYIEICKLIIEPFSDRLYSWKKSDLPKRVAKAGTQLVKTFKLRTPPREAIFLDRKLGGTFIFLSVLGFEENSYQWLKNKIESFS